MTAWRWRVRQLSDSQATQANIRQTESDMDYYTDQERFAWPDCRRITYSILYERIDADRHWHRHFEETYFGLRTFVVLSIPLIMYLVYHIYRMHSSPEALLLTLTAIPFIGHALGVIVFGCFAFSPLFSNDVRIAAALICVVYVFGLRRVMRCSALPARDIGRQRDVFCDSAVFHYILGLDLSRAVILSTYGHREVTEQVSKSIEQYRDLNYEKSYDLCIECMAILLQTFLHRNIVAARNLMSPSVLPGRVEFRLPVAEWNNSDLMVRLASTLLAHAYPDYANSVYAIRCICDDQRKGPYVSIKKEHADLAWQALAHCYQVNLREQLIA
jgi:hypothetical protein